MVLPWLRRLVSRLGGAGELPGDFRGELAGGEYVLAVARAETGPLVATNLGLWLPEGRRVDWHLISKATWQNGVLAVVEAEERPVAEAVVLLQDRPVQRFRLTTPRRLPDVVHKRVTGSVRSRHHRELPGGGVWVVQRKLAGRSGVVLQGRPDPGTDEEAVLVLLREIAERLPHAPGE
ncbi:hypothetical protein [Saccharopolyspora rectivirgula]|jgi:hypothetical protein|uniref:hypothetical protein n=1 Tax=Saccharopolyspora rectivirgula TaxID=28042 RepID=UPI00040805C0|nr:hypothetical protein [Saccharopolyspora rectivirgula]